MVTRQDSRIHPIPRRAARFRDCNCPGWRQGGCSRRCRFCLPVNLVKCDSAQGREKDPPTCALSVPLPVPLSLEGQREGCRSPSSAVRAGRRGNRCGCCRRGDGVAGCRASTRVEGDRTAHVRCIVGKRAVVGVGRNSLALYGGCECSSVGVCGALSASIHWMFFI